VNAQLESFYFYIIPDCLMALKDFLTSSQPSDSEAKSDLLIVSSQVQSDLSDDLPPPAKRISTHQQSNDQSMSASTSAQRISTQVSSDTKSDIETSIDILIKTPQIILLEDQHNANSNCLVLAVRKEERCLNQNSKHVFCLVRRSDANDNRTWRNQFAWFGQKSDCLWL
jgi:hypothetical protein